VCAVLTDNDYPKARNYWKWLKTKLNSEGSELVSNTNQLKMQSKDGKFYNTDVMDTEQALRLIQSIPSKKAEPFKLWLQKLIQLHDFYIDTSLAMWYVQNIKELPLVTGGSILKGFSRCLNHHLRRLVLLISVFKNQITKCNNSYNQHTKSKKPFISNHGITPLVRM